VLPREHEEDPPRFEHTPAAAIPSVALPGVTPRVLVGAAFSVDSPVRALSPAVYLDIALAAGATLTLPELAAQRALGVTKTNSRAEQGLAPSPALPYPVACARLRKHPSLFDTPQKFGLTPSANSSSTSSRPIQKPETSFENLAVVGRSGGRGRARASAVVRASSTSSPPTARCGC